MVKMKLKTQKEIRFEILRKLHKEMKVPIPTAQKITDLIVEIYDSEAIKWVKELRDGIGYTSEYFDGQFNWIMNFFNITEEDLK